MYNLSGLACFMSEISSGFSHMQVLIPGDTDTTYWCTVRPLPDVAQEEEIFLYRVRTQLGQCCLVYTCMQKIPASSNARVGHCQCVKTVKIFLRCIYISY